MTRLASPRAPSASSTWQTEDELLAFVMQAAALYGWRAYHVRNSRAGIVQGHTGFPDIVLVSRAHNGDRGRIIYRELKSEKGKLTPEQCDWGAAIRAAGGDWDVWRPSDWSRIVRELSGE